MKITFCIVLCLIGVIGGAMAGQYLAHHAPLFGGINMMGEPGSPARQSLVPGHVALLGTLGGIAGLLLGVVRVLTAKPRSTPTKQTGRELPSKIDFPK